MLSRRSCIRGLVASMMICVLGTGTVFGFEAPTEKAILTIAGKIALSNGDKGVRFDRPMLERLGMARIDTATPWFEGVSRFEGVPMAKLLAAVGASGERVVVTALNGYQTEIPIADFERYGVILAMKRDGQYMAVKDKGPLFVIYPFDQSPDLRQQTFFGRSAWQVMEIIVQ